MKSDERETDGEFAPTRPRRRGQALYLAIAIIALIGLAFGLSPFTFDPLAPERGFIFQSGLGLPSNEELPRPGDEVAAAIIAIDVEEQRWLWAPIAATADYTITFVALDPSATLSWPENPWDRGRQFEQSYLWNQSNGYSAQGHTRQLAVGILTYRSTVERHADQVARSIINELVDYAPNVLVRADTPSPGTTAPLALVEDGWVEVTCGDRVQPFVLKFDEDWYRSYGLNYVDGEYCTFELSLENVREYPIIGLSFERLEHFSTLFRFSEAECRVGSSDSWRFCRDLRIGPGERVIVKQTGVFDGCERSGPSGGGSRVYGDMPLRFSHVGSAMGRVIPSRFRLSIDWPGNVANCPFHLPLTESREAIREWVANELDPAEPGLEVEMVAPIRHSGVFQQASSESRRFGEFLTVFRATSTTKTCLGIVGHDREWPGPMDELRDAEPSDLPLFSETPVSIGMNYSSTESRERQALIGFWTPATRDKRDDYVRGLFVAINRGAVPDLAERPVIFVSVSDSREVLYPGGAWRDGFYSGELGRDLPSGIRRLEFGLAPTKDGPVTDVIEVPRGRMEFFDESED